MKSNAVLYIIPEIQFKIQRKYLIQLFCVAEHAIGSGSHHGAHEIDALDTVLAVERIVGQNVQSETVRVANRFGQMLAVGRAARNSSRIS